MSLGTAPAPSAPTAGPPQAGGRAAEPRSGRRHWFTVVLVLAMLAAVLASVARGYYRDGPLEPDAPTAQGSKAVVQVLEDLGVDVDVDRHTADAVEALHSGRTVLVTAPGSLGAEQIIALADAQEEAGGRLVLVQPDLVTLSYLSPQISPPAPLHTGGQVEAGPDCGDLSQGAGVLELPTAEDGIRGAASLYRVGDAGSSCFSTEEGALVAEHDGVLVLGSADLLTNDGVGRADNSALVLGSLGADGELSWYAPSATDPMSSTSQTLLGYLPDWAGPLLLWLLLVAAVALVALGRRFGPVVVEPLPVTVRPQELVLGRARLLQRSNSRDAAARALRSATSTRLADRFGLRHESALDGLLAALAPHVDRTPEQLRMLLGPTPVTSDQGLVRLAHDLDRLEKEIDR
ncbi:DUF4350 domain-containing protein [Brachybacterium sp. Z12]|uniref:DUF4350 domain-containing protein n=1 Tax=Brachybacterium sp. Z12 TaxID=2759167 RepID=UPI001861D03C|nr:DUF4350 domain-containing protein [Brachybacterium sp. Z12]QNN81833.1 DUF4350 domain-containing protein [Brachybacterium sp. Z12]